MNQPLRNMSVIGPPIGSSKAVSQQRLSGFSLVELVCVLAIISILIGMLLPAVQRIRESARNISCRNNVRQIVLAAHAFDAFNRRIPPGSLGFNDVIEFQTMDPIDTTHPWFDPSHAGHWKQAQHTSSLLFLLPILELDSLANQVPHSLLTWRGLYADYREVDPGAPAWIGDIPEMQDLAEVPVSTFLCPTDNLNQAKQSAIPLVTSQPAYVHSVQADFLLAEPLLGSLLVPAGTNYLACAGASSGGRQPDPELDRYRGYGSCRQPISIGDVRDGSSHTIMYGENIGQINDRKRRFYFPWAFAGLMRGRGILPWKQNRLDSAPEFLLFGDVEYSYMAGFGSAHPSTVTVGMGDGSVKGISRLTSVETFYALTGGYDGTVHGHF